MNEFDPAMYTITVKKEATEDGLLFVARVRELPDVLVCEESAENAYEEALAVIETSKEMFDETQQEFPKPEESENKEYSGRLPIRTTKSLHKRLAQAAEHEGVSLNAYVNQLLSINYTVKELGNQLAQAQRLVYRFTENLSTMGASAASVYLATGHEGFNTYHITGSPLESGTGVAGDFSNPVKVPQEIHPAVWGRLSE